MKHADIFNTLVNNKINAFINGFNVDATGLFVGDDGIVHPGEYGEYRERVCIDLLRCFIPQRLSIGTGFIINSDKEVSNQCDIVVYDSINSISLENQQNQRFFPVESVAAVGEIKSELSKSDLFTVLEKLSDVKKMRERIKTPSRINPAVGTPSVPYRPQLSPHDQIGTFVICKKLKLSEDSFENLASELDEFYRDYHISHRHNMILDIEHGVLVYRNERGNTPFQYALEKIYPTYCFQAENDKHIRIFLNLLMLLTHNINILYPELGDYFELNHFITEQS